MSNKLDLLFCAGFHMWKRSFIRAYLGHEARRIVFVSSPLEARLWGMGPGTPLVVWGRRGPQELEALARGVGAPIWRMEDGFLRSVGLGSAYEVPASLVLDKTGIYFDATQTSDLERTLDGSAFAPEELARADALAAAIVASTLSKYNFPQVLGAPALEVPRGRTVVLVPGQVETDASIQFGAVDVRTNLQLLRAAREARPDAYVLYKPHPDVLSRNHARDELIDARRDRLADAIVIDRTLPECLAVADEIHTTTSLVGFEALLRHKRVVTYGRPFYAGWGLTSDRHPCVRRRRQLSLAELVAGALIRYPMYIDLRTWAPSTPERVVVDLRQRLNAGTARPLTPFARQARRVRLSLCGLMHLDGLLRSPR